MSTETILFTSVAKWEDLRSIDIKINSLEVTDKITPSLFHCKILICRLILAAFPEVIASPVPQTENYIYVIAKKEYFQTSGLQNFLKLKKLWFSDLQPVIYDIYRECYEYSMLFKLAPSWNKFGQYLCQGKNFLLYTEDFNAVKLGVNIKKEGLFLEFSATKLKAYPLKVEELGLVPSLLAEFKQNPEGKIRLGQHWAKVLPSMIKVRLLRLLKQMPKTCIFRNYQELRKHWKDMYGYILPESSEGLLFYEVCFAPAPEQIFVYPDICLQSELPKTVRCNNQAQICIQFVESLRNEIRTICGKSLSLVKYNPKQTSYTPSLSLRPAKEIKTEIKNSQISRMPSIYGNINTERKFENEITVKNFKQQTLNFPKIENSNLPENSTSSNCSSNLRNLSLPNTILSQYIQSAPIQKSLIIDPKIEDNMGIKSKTVKSLLDLMKCNDNAARKGALFQENSDTSFPKSSPAKRVRMIGSNPVASSKRVTDYFKEQKPNFNKAAKIKEKLQFQNLLKNE